ncbi:hypothetical protein FTE28_04700 [Bacillus licheniformis]|jgi:hypothetical protein|uniref:SMI1/KNR4 family protein n=1 Tax=Bacillus licheniformis (strain ATCC 14580 / DSM 13 / JCM 2505 / CCUG 7422 / NBRC 12200 / NCIMB 9375 / NCTC 10341 / NRRL NRS-1264 / Gibson 46) TaxID=279010 RepID=Q62U12_BACLD|nr:hypothetical protein BL01394 [Bacillus licheniformis DSM 13 = ATCC 14580]AKQ73406.1 hypothetical protein MUY_002274 [Bacillus licheniformis WX-02]AMR10607.1 hypothetical protein AB684_10585 [Bacillus licheniformis]APJ27273.1 hypothetical protein BSZ43_10975 [Bacillus sp. H15-1]ASV15672.1 hypothetical protein CJO35_11065 [Bacillus sp. 1s-1]EQM27674.1 hypothetical protein N399_12410 [Bacillus licheniformis CG-B52]KUL09014.1 hypothetical protein LI17339_16040 [Bacillus licheniformis LMG 17339
MLVFFEVGEGTYLTLDLDQEEENGICPVYYFDKIIAASLEEFSRKWMKKNQTIIFMPKLT